MPRNEIPEMVMIYEHLILVTDWGSDKHKFSGVCITSFGSRPPGYYSNGWAKLSAKIWTGTVNLEVT
jgi:hypothetical protein